MPLPKQSSFQQVASHAFQADFRPPATLHPVSNPGWAPLSYYPNMFDVSAYGDSGARRTGAATRGGRRTPRPGSGVAVRRQRQSGLFARSCRSAPLPAAIRGKGHDRIDVFDMRRC